MTGYRYQYEGVIFAGTVILLVVILVLTAGFTLCLIPLFIIVIFTVSFFINRASHQALVEGGKNIQEIPSLAPLAASCKKGLRAGRTDIVIVRNEAVNAYTFGLSNPKMIVLNSALVEIMDEGGLRFVIGHEMGHIVLGHTWFLTLLNSLSVLPTSLGVYTLTRLAFLLWGRMSEYSADRAGLLACGNLNKAVSTLIKITASDVHTPGQLQRALQIIEKEDDSILNLLGETLSMHPLTINRIEQLEEYASSTAYRRHQAEYDRSG